MYFLWTHLCPFVTQFFRFSWFIYLFCKKLAQSTHFPTIFVAWRVDVFWFSSLIVSEIWLYDTLTTSNYSSSFKLGFRWNANDKFENNMMSIFALGYYGLHSERGKPSCAKPIPKAVIFLQEKQIFLTFDFLSRRWTGGNGVLSWLMKATRAPLSLS